MHPIVQEVSSGHTPESLALCLADAPGLVILRSGFFQGSQARYSFVAAKPFLTFCSEGTRCVIHTDGGVRTLYGDPWSCLEALLTRYEVPNQPDFPFPLGGCFGFWGYDLKNHVEPKLRPRAPRELEVPDCHVGFHDSLVVFDHALGKTWVVSTGLETDGSRSDARAAAQAEDWRRLLCGPPPPAPVYPPLPSLSVRSNFSRDQFLRAVHAAQKYIRFGHIYQVNLSQRLEAAWSLPGKALFDALASSSPAPFAAYLDAGSFQIASSSPEQFLHLSGSHARTRPIKGTRPRSTDSTRDAQLSYELQTSPKEMAELVMITDLLRNDLGKVCDFGSVQVPELARLEKYPHVQHLVSTVEGRLRPDVSHLRAVASCFPGGSITGAPKFRAMEIIDELEPAARGPYTGALGYIGFNQESQLSILIRTAVCHAGRAWFAVGAGIVADSDPVSEYEETLTKAGGFLAALRRAGHVTESADTVFQAQA
jgi:para-aminobenzoate synthetase component 1